MDMISLSEDAGYWFWHRVDSLRGKRQLIDLAGEAEIEYTRIKNQRSDNRLPKVEDVVRLSVALGCSINYLITGVDHDKEIPGNLIPIVQALKVASEEDLALIRRVLRIPDEGVLSEQNA